jgi:peptidyl-dipeptidase A
MNYAPDDHVMAGDIMKTTTTICIFLFIGLVSLTCVTLAGTPEEDFRAFLQAYETKAIPLSKESSLASFNASVSGKDADYEKAAQAQLALEKIHADKASFAKLKAFREAGKITDPLLKRQLDVLFLTFLGSQIDQSTIQELIRRSTEIGQTFYTFRTKALGRTLGDNEVDSLLKYSTDSTELQAVWEASKGIGRTIAPDLIELVKLRNKAAKSLGFSDYYEMQLQLTEQDPAEIAALFDQLDSLTRGPFVILKREIDSALAARFGITRSQLRPWHYQDRFFQGAPGIYAVNLDSYYTDKDPVALARTYFAGIGLPVDSILARSDLYERPGKYQHAYCSDIDRAGDVRAVCNVRPDYSWTNTMLHELGHGVYDYYNDRQLPWLLRNAAHSFTSEAVANFFGKLAGNPKWLVQVAGVPQTEIDSVAGDCVRMQRLEQLVFSRWAQVMVRFERALYQNPDQDLNQLWWSLVTKYQGMKCPEGRNEPDWAAKIHLVDAPVYYHNYLMGELLSSQFAATIGRTVLNSADPFSESFAGDPRIGQFFVDKVFRPGNRYTWNEMIERATGEKLTAEHYARQFVEAR